MLVAIVFGTIARPIWVLTSAVVNDHDQRRPPPRGFVDDASRLNETAIIKVWDVPPDDAAAEAGLRRLFLQAKRDRLSVSVAGARHSMGGQTIAAEGIQINMLTHCAIAFNPQKQLLHVQAGARWSQIISFLDPMKLSVAIMQSNNDFTVGGSLSVNCHGWQFDRPPIDSTVESFRIMLADGSVRTCNRKENSELFSLALGGYGLFGVILDADLHVVANERYEVEQFSQPTTNFLGAWQEHLQPVSEIGMAFGRLSIDRENFLNDSLLYVIRRKPSSSGGLPTLQAPSGQSFARAVFLASVDSDYGKTLRWETEKYLITRIAGRMFSRNQLLDQPVEIVANRTDTTTDLLQEYFVPPDRLGDFLASLRMIVPRNDGNLLNVTLRDVREDYDSFLHYADKQMITVALLYHVSRAGKENSKMSKLTQESISAALECGGRFYLPYRLDATVEQFERAYPMAHLFFQMKRQYDPDLLFRNQFYLHYSGV